MLQTQKFIERTTTHVTMMLQEQTIEMVIFILLLPRAKSLEGPNVYGRDFAICVPSFVALSTRYNTLLKNVTSVIIGVA